jgi:sugar-specific transcriptional regulator TrmB
MKKQTNEQKVLKALTDNGPMTQAELAKLTKVKGVYQLVSKMVREGKLAKNGKQVMLMAVDETTKIDGRKVSEAIYKPTKIKNILEHFQDERDRLVKEIEIRLNEYAYVMNQLMKLDDEA